MANHKALDLSSVEEIRDWANESFATSKGTITLSSDAWEGEEGGPFSQVVTIQDATENSKIDLQPDAVTLAQMAADGVTSLWVQNDSGVLTALAMGAIPSEDMTVQYTRTEVAA